MEKPELSDARQVENHLNELVNEASNYLDRKLEQRELRDKVDLASRSKR